MPPDTNHRAGISGAAIASDCQLPCSTAHMQAAHSGQPYESNRPCSGPCTPGWSQLLAHLATRLCLVTHPVPHFKQLFSWDCGLACALMALKAVGLHHCNYSQLRQLCPTTSIWTIDLAHLLKRFGLDVTFLTITLGPNPAFYNESFYLANMQEDELRVSQLFRDAGSAGIALAQRSVCWQEIATHLMSGSTLVVVLVDKRKLDPWLMAADMCLPYALCGMDLGYTGHYIMLVGYDAATGQFIAKDPSNEDPGEVRIAAAALDAARRAFGTDEDILFIRHTVLMHTAVVVPKPLPPLPPTAHAADIADKQQPQQAGLPVPLGQLCRQVLTPGCLQHPTLPPSPWQVPAQQPWQQQQQQQHVTQPLQQPLLVHPCHWDLVGVPRLTTQSAHAGGGLVSPELLLPPPPAELLAGLWWLAHAVTEDQAACQHPDSRTHSQAHAQVSPQHDCNMTQAGSINSQCPTVTTSGVSSLSLPQPHPLCSTHSPGTQSQHASVATATDSAVPAPVSASVPAPVSGLAAAAAAPGQLQPAAGVLASGAGKAASKSAAGRPTAGSQTSTSWAQFWCWTPTWTLSTAPQHNGPSSSSDSSAVPSGGTESSSVSTSSSSSSSSCESQPLLGAGGLQQGLEQSVDSPEQRTCAVVEPAAAS